MRAYKGIYCSSAPFLEERLLRDLLRLPADFLLPLPDFLPLRLRLADFLLGAAFLRDPRLLGAMLMKGLWRSGGEIQQPTHDRRPSWTVPESTAIRR